MVALFVILFVAVLLSIDLIIQRRQKKYPLMSTVPQTQATPFSTDMVRFPKGVFFHPGHTWARMQTGEEIVVGIDDFIQKALGRIERVTVPSKGQRVKQGEPVITLQHQGKMISLVAPVSGTVYAINTDVLDNPALITENPFEAGWLFMVEPEQLATNISVLSIAENAFSWLKEETFRFREFLASNSMQPAMVGDTMLDGGMPVSGSLDYLDESGLKKFEEQFLR
jgi:glycine cleavage system H protein